MDYFFKNTIQIGPCVKAIAKDDLHDLYAHRKLINIEKLAFPLREARRDLTARHKYKTLASRTHDPDSRNRSAAALEEDRQGGIEGEGEGVGQGGEGVGVVQGEEAGLVAKEGVRA